jgi:hypothetical protein
VFKVARFVVKGKQTRAVTSKSRMIELFLSERGARRVGGWGFGDVDVGVGMGSVRTSEQRPKRRRKSMWGNPRGGEGEKGGGAARDGIGIGGGRARPFVRVPKSSHGPDGVELVESLIHSEEELRDISC